MNVEFVNNCVYDVADLSLVVSRVVVVGLSTVVLIAEVVVVDVVCVLEKSKYRGCMYLTETCVPKNN